MKEITKKVRRKVGKIKGIEKTYALIKTLASPSNSEPSEALIDRTMYGIESLPLLGKEYWWLLFFGQIGRKPVQVMLLLYRKHGNSMLFNGKKVALKKMGEGRFQGVAAGWVFDGKKMHELEDTNAITVIDKKKKTLTSSLGGRELVLKGGFPEYSLKLGELIDLSTSTGNGVKTRDANGVFLPPFGVGWVNLYPKAKGKVLGKKFNGTAHLQKVVGVTIYGGFHWSRLVFEDNSSLSFFCIKPEKNSKMFLHKHLMFCNGKTGEITKLKNPKLNISKKTGKKTVWVVEGKAAGKKVKIELESYAEKKFTMENGGWQVYIEYAVTPTRLILTSKGEKITLSDLGKGVGTFEDAYGFMV